MDDDELVTVFEAGEPGLVAVAHSILEDAGIPYYAKNDSTQDLVGWGRFGTGFNLALGAVRFQVRWSDAETAKALLRELSPKDVTEG